ncbi:hypothetical protein [Palleronia caenipelagi]|uniref:Uncharacterized protein n=1 Tax=Palleronia caenipelagi TaxID=2489174 RepID=A0A547PS65_9RHOB|nr:hypothetical protein [Palleronia caenipelagi]TRD16986.1 hypothetical protein FEV53_13700 [Palleronia caenipelagi]
MTRIYIAAGLLTLIAALGLTAYGWGRADKGAAIQIDRAARQVDAIRHAKEIEDEIRDRTDDALVDGLLRNRAGPE